MRILDSESEVWLFGKVFTGVHAQRVFIAYLMAWVLCAFTAGYFIGYFS